VSKSLIALVRAMGDGTTPWSRLMLALPALLFVATTLAGCAPSTTVSSRDPTWVAPEKIPPMPRDPRDPVARVSWVLGYDMREFDRAMRWLDKDVPEGPERTRARALAHMLGMGELGRAELIRPGIALFEQAARDFPGDGRLSLWHAYMLYMAAWIERDAELRDDALDRLWGCIPVDPRFNTVGPELTVAGDPAAAPATLEKARVALYDVMRETLDLQLVGDAVARAKLRRSWNSPLTPYLISATFAMKGDISILTGDVATARREYYKAIHDSQAFRWPWRAEVARRFENTDAVAAGFADGGEYALGSTFPWARGVGPSYAIETFGGRVGNGTCTFCHSHVSVFDDTEATPPAVGWIRGQFRVDGEIPDPAPYFYALASTRKDAKPAGLYVGLQIPPDAPPDYYLRDDLYRDEFLLTVPPGRYFVAGVLSTGDDGKGRLGTTQYKGYTRGFLGLPRYVTVEVGTVTDARDMPIVLKRADD
jgi:hypothetical protein